MAELMDARREQFCKLVAAGVDAYRAHGQAGYRPDRSNSSKLSRQPDVAARIKELQQQEAERLAQARGDGSGETGEQLLRIAAERAMATGNLVALVQAAKGLAESDGSLDPAPVEVDAAEERRRILAELFRLMPEAAHPSLEAYLAQPAARPSAVRAIKRQP
jgi:hypothetical protein